MCIRDRFYKMLLIEPGISKENNSGILTHKLILNKGSENVILTFINSLKDIPTEEVRQTPDFGKCYRSLQ